MIESSALLVFKGKHIKKLEERKEWREGRKEEREKEGNRVSLD